MTTSPPSASARSVAFRAASSSRWCALSRTAVCLVSLAWLAGCAADATVSAVGADARAGDVGDAPGDVVRDTADAGGADAARPGDGATAGADGDEDVADSDASGAPSADGGDAQDGVDAEDEVDAEDVAPDPCPGGRDDPACDDGNPCTHDECLPEEGGCVSRAVDGAPCSGEGGCGTGRCEGGRCVDHDRCDDTAVCTIDHCLSDGTCEYEVTHPVGRPALDFALVDENPLSATYTQTVSFETLEGRIIVLVFMASACAPCCVQGEAARSLVDELRDDPDVFIAAVDVNSVLDRGSATSIEACVTVDHDGLPPLESDWPYLRDNDEWRIWNRYCASNYKTVVIDAARQIRYYREVNFEDPPFRRELLRAIEGARALPEPPDPEPPDPAD